MIFYSEATVPQLSIHYIGNKADNELAQYSESSIYIDDADLMQTLLTYFINSWKTPEFHQFTFNNGEVQLNPVFQYAKKIFQDPNLLHETSISIASYLYEKSAHPNIKSGDLLIAYLHDVLVDDELIDAIAIFKSENKDLFLTMNWDQKTADINQDMGIALNKIDKAALIFNTDEEHGFKVLSLDRSNRGQEALYWKEHFLGLTPKTNDFFQTKQMIQITKSFVDERLKPLEDIDKSEEAAIMHRSKEFFQKSEDFSQTEYQEKMFQEPAVQQAFEEYVGEYQEENNIQLEDSFPISNAAVKQQNKVFKSIIKLDKNFHIYVHGDRRLIEKGKDEDGRKFYKIYFDAEH